MKKVAREIGKAQSSEIEAQVVNVGKKREANWVELEAVDNRAQKRIRGNQTPKKTPTDDVSAVATMQHHREQ